MFPIACGKACGGPGVFFHESGFNAWQQKRSFIQVKVENCPAAWPILGVLLAVVAERWSEAGLPLSPSSSGHADDLGGAQDVEAVHEGDADVDFGGLAVGISCDDALSEGL